ncbi:hypothetical protein E8E13_008001 [Curvularia kusanoi]|uniref:Uncharacterized protein n=1 Tax=Curvularia kusanoi TaxID=90978 RepID=A0A9P4WBH6_CURKU|nr:hypothetical protein E8E13_008001 [Curvularia kusanoi]
MQISLSQYLQPTSDYPGLHLPRNQWPRGMHLDASGTPVYPPGVTCKALGEEDLYFPVTWRVWVGVVMGMLLYVVWPAYVLYYLIRTSADEAVERTDRQHGTFEEAHDEFTGGE